MVDCCLLLWRSLKSFNYLNILPEFCKFLQVPWHLYQVAATFSSKVTKHRKKLRFRRRSGYRSPVEICCKSRCTSQWRIWLVKILKNFLSPTKNFIFEKLQFFRKSKEIYRKNTRFNEIFRKFLLNFSFYRHLKIQLPYMVIFSEKFCNHLKDYFITSSLVPEWLAYDL